VVPTVKLPASSLRYTGPLQGCKCSACMEALGSEEDLLAYADGFNDEPEPFPIK
jgi:hypothetical protein